jgi:hypothetical protein
MMEVRIWYLSPLVIYSIDHLLNYGKRKKEITFPSLIMVVRSGMI